jgi:hypothetical protein
MHVAGQSPEATRSRHSTLITEIGGPREKIYLFVG